MKKLGLQKAYTTDEQTQLAFRCVLSLPLLPCNDIELGLGDVKLLDIDDSASHQLMQQLFRYVERHWIKKSSIGSSRLSVRDNTSRTNNAMESFHAAMRQRVKVAHPNLPNPKTELQISWSGIDKSIPGLQSLHAKMLQCDLDQAWQAVSFLYIVLSAS